MNTRISGSESSENIILRKISWHTIFGMDYSYLQNPQSALAARPQQSSEQARDSTALWEMLKQTDPKLHVFAFLLFY